MKKNIFNPIKVMALFVVMLFATYSCSDLLDNPLKDKVTGDDLTLLLVDVNFFDTKFNFHFVDEDGVYLDNKKLNVLISGNDAANIVDLAGNKSEEYSTTYGNLELALDPNISVTEANPVEFTVTAYADDFSYFGYPVEVSYSEKGGYDVEVIMSSTSINKSATLNPGLEPFDLKFNNTLVNVGPSISGVYIPRPENKDGKNYYGFFYSNKMPAGIFTMTNYKGEVNNKWGIEGIYGQTTLDKSLLLGHNDFNVSLNSKAILYTVTQPENIKCTSGLNITVTEKSGKTGTGSFKFTINSGDKLVHSGIISGSSMPFTVNTGAFYYPIGTTSLTINVEGDSQYAISPAQTTVTSLCGSTIAVTATPNSKLIPYKISVTASCPNNNIGIAPTINGRYKIKGSSEPWSRFSFSAGSCTLLLVPGETYSIVGKIANSDMSFDFPTDESKIKEVVASALAGSKDLANIVFTFSGTSTQKAIDVKISFKEGYCPF